MKRLLAWFYKPDVPKVIVIPEPPLCIATGLKGHPMCKVCQCYPECRIDCPDWKACKRKLREYWTEKEKKQGSPDFDMEMG